MAWRLIKSVCVVLAIACLPNSYGVLTPLGDIRDSVTVHHSEGKKTTTLAFSLADDNPQALQIKILSTHGTTQQASLSFQLLTQIQGTILPNNNVSTLIPYIPAAIAMLTLIQGANVPQLHPGLSISDIMIRKNELYLMIEGLTFYIGFDSPQQILVSIGIPVGDNNKKKKEHFFIDTQPSEAQAIEEPSPGNLFFILI